MNTNDKTWESTKSNYLRQVESVLTAAKYPSRKSIMEEVCLHLEQRYAELPAEKRNWEGFQQVITEMGPPSDYAELLGVGRLKRRIITWRRIAVGVPIILVLLAYGMYKGIIPLGVYSGPRTYVIPELVGAPLEHAFVSDGKLVGEWVSVDFVRSPSQFVPGKQKYKDKPWLNRLTFIDGGDMVGIVKGSESSWASRCKWTKGWIVDREDKIQAQYAIKETDGELYLFYPWLSGDVSIRYQPPCYYVLKKVRPGGKNGSATLAASMLPLVAATNEVPKDLDAKIAQLSKNGTTLDEVLRLLGEPQSYRWGGKTFNKDNLPATYLLEYPNRISIAVSGGRVRELRCAQPGPGFTWQGKLRLGSSLEEVLEVLGPPANTVTGKKLSFESGVLYKDCGGKKGNCYYSQPEQNIRLFFTDYKVSALYVPVGEGGAGGGGGGDFKFLKVVAIHEVKEYQDVRFKDLSKLKLADRPGLPATLTFNQKTVWPTEMPPGAEPARLLASGMNPGLGMHNLHREGLTGKGVNVAIIDQPLYQDHPEFAGKIAAYHDVGCESESSMHGPAVASLLVGAKCGTAPDARLYFVAAPSWTGDSAYQAKALDWIIDQNEKLPAGEKIRVVSVSAAPSGSASPFKQNKEKWDAACARAEQAGMLVLDCTQHHGFLGPCYYDAADPEAVSKCKPGFPGFPRRLGMPIKSNRLLVPCSPRTVAEEYVKGNCSYQYCGRGGLSWGIPYAAGVLALGWQARPELTGPQMRELLFASAHVTPDGTKIINPPAFIEAVKRLERATNQ